MAESIDQLKERFVDDTLELIQELEDLLLMMKDDGADSSSIDQIFRIVHTIKGSGGMLGFDRLLKITHNLEDIYEHVRSNEIEFSKELLEITLETVDVMRFLVSDLEDISLEQEKVFNITHKKILKFDAEKDNKGNQSGAQLGLDETDYAPVNQIEILPDTFYVYFKPNTKLKEILSDPSYLIKELTLKGEYLFFGGNDEDYDPESTNEWGFDNEWAMLLLSTYRKEDLLDVFSVLDDLCDVVVEKIADGNLLEIKDAVKKIKKIYIKDSIVPPFEKVMEIAEAFEDDLTKIRDAEKIEKVIKSDKDSSASDASVKTIKSIRVSTEKIDHLMNLVSDFVTSQARLNLFAQESDDEDLIAVAEKFSSFSKQLRDSAFSISLVPFAISVTRYRRMVYDLSNKLGKSVEFLTIGEETELDKKIIELLADPIMHILRNSIDHGIESVDERKQAGKDPVGKIKMKVFHQSNNVIIRIEDDGKGIDFEKIRTIAIERGLIDADEKLSEKELRDLIFLPGFSSAQTISNVSGRGVGLDVVKRNISQIRGEIELDSNVGVGSAFILKLPLTLSIIDALQVKISERDFILPMNQVDKILSVHKNDFNDKMNQFMTLDGEQIPYFKLRKDFNIDGDEPERQEAVIANYGTEKIALVVDTVVGESQTVIKPLGKHFRNQEFISGATVLGDGSVALVVDVNKIATYFSKQ